MDGAKICRNSKGKSCLEKGEKEGVIEINGAWRQMAEVQNTGRSRLVG